MGNTTPDDQLEFDLGAEEKETEISLEDEKENEAPEASVEQEAPAVEEKQAQKDELDSVSEAVQKRIAKLTAKMREAERREQAAIEYAKGLQNQTQELQQKLVSTDYSRLNETKTRLETQQATLRQIIKKAREEGDIDTETEAQQRLGELAYEQRQVAAYLQQQETMREERAAQAQQPQQQRQQQQPQRPKPSPRAEKWAAENSWFGQDRTLTYAAWGIHQTLIEDEGVDPNTEEYYTELDRRLRDEFPRRFASQQAEQPVARQQRPASAVAPASRSSGVASTRRSVRLSPSQVAIAKKLGVPLEEYAKYVKE